jgi:cytochrome c-type protein NapC
MTLKRTNGQSAISGKASWGLMVGIFIAGMIAVIGIERGLAWTNTESFCIGCHEIHDVNRSGVRAICSDCHVPKPLLPKLWRKVRATGEIWGKITGKINTSEKFEQHRYELAMRVWKSMKKNDSLECRNCHSDGAMSQDAQTEKAWARHSKAKEKGQTCIDCHFGIAHWEPEGELGPQDLDINSL